MTSARRLADLTERDIPYMWICGGVSVNHHRLSDFRTDHGELLEQLRQMQKDDSSGESRRRRAARERAAKERQQRIEQAQAELEKLKAGRQQRKSKSKSEPRASTRDPESRQMKMSDGGFRRAYNVKFASEGESRLIVGGDVTNQGTDSGLMGPMHQQFVQDYATTPHEYLVDGRFQKWTT